MLPEKGTYFAQLEGAVVGKGKSCSQFVLSFQVTHVSKSGQWQELTTSFLRHVYVYLSDAAWGTSQKKLESLGFNGDFCNPNFTNVKEGVELKCDHQIYEGQTRDKWELANWGGTEVERASADIVRQLQAKWKVKAAKPAPKLPSKPPVQQEPVDGPEELDIPEENIPH